MKRSAANDEEIEKSANLQKKMKVEKVATKKEIQSIVSEIDMRQAKINYEEKLDAKRRAMESVMELERRMAQKFEESLFEAELRNTDASGYDNRRIERQVKISQLEADRNSMDSQIQTNNNHINQLKHNIDATRNMLKMYIEIPGMKAECKGREDTLKSLLGDLKRDKFERNKAENLMNELNQKIQSINRQIIQLKNEDDADSDTRFGAFEEDLEKILESMSQMKQEGLALKQKYEEARDMAKEAQTAYRQQQDAFKDNMDQRGHPHRM